MRLVEAYLARFKTGEGGQGMAAVLRGDHGSGKTHAVRYAMEKVKPLAPAGDGGLGSVQLYAKVEGPDLLAVYRQLLKPVTKQDLNDLSLRLLALAASQQVGEETTDEQTREKIAEKLRRDPKAVYKLFSSYLVEKGAVQEKQESEVQKRTGGGDDFRRAFSYLQEPELAGDAYKWLTGQQVSQKRLTHLGVSGPIADPEAIKTALQLLATLFNRIGRPLFIYLDQYEKLVLNLEKELAVTNAGLLHSLVEGIPRENGMFVIAGNEEAWAALPRDLKGRFAGNVIDLPVLKPEEASEMIRLYLTPPGEEFVMAPPGADISGMKRQFFPFEPAAVRDIVSFSAGNIRRLLQICSKVIESALPSREVVTSVKVEEVLGDANLDYYSLGTVREEVEGMLRERLLSFRRDFRVGKVEVDLAVVDRDDTPLLLIEISEAVFHEQEAARARRPTSSASAGFASRGCRPPSSSSSSAT